MRSFDGRLYEPIAVYTYQKEVSFIMIVLKVYYQLLDLMNRTSCVGNVR